MSMDYPHLGLLLGVSATRREAESAHPCAPVVPEPEPRRKAPRTRAPRTRRTLAGALHHLADAVAPAHGGEVGHPAR